MGRRGLRADRSAFYLSIGAGARSRWSSPRDSDSFRRVSCSPNMYRRFTGRCRPPRKTCGQLMRSLTHMQYRRRGRPMLRRAKRHGSTTPPHAGRVRSVIFSRQNPLPEAAESCHQSRLVKQAHVQIQTSALAQSARLQLLDRASSASMNARSSVLPLTARAIRQQSALFDGDAGRVIRV